MSVGIFLPFLPSPFILKFLVLQGSSCRDASSILSLLLQDSSFKSQAVSSPFPLSGFVTLLLLYFLGCRFYPVLPPGDLNEQRISLEPLLTQHLVQNIVRSRYLTNVECLNKYFGCS